MWDLKQKSKQEVQKLLKLGIDSSIVDTATHLTKAQIEELKNLYIE